MGGVEKEVFNPPHFFVVNSTSVLCNTVTQANWKSSCGRFEKYVHIELEFVCQIEQFTKYLSVSRD